VPQCAVPEDEVIPSIEIGQLRLLWDAGAVGAGAQRFHLIIVLRVLGTVQGRRLLRAKLVPALQREGTSRAEPGCRHRGRRRWGRGLQGGRRAPCAGGSAADEGRWWRMREPPVVCPQSEDACRS